MPRTGPADAPRELRELRERISEAIRAARRTKGWNQQRLGQALDTNRFAVGRWEKGEVDPKAADAARLEQVLEVTGLVRLVEERDAVGERQPAAARDLALARMLARQGIRRLRIVLADDLDVADLVARPTLEAADVDVVVPTVKQEMVVFNQARPLYSHVEAQLKRLQDVATANEGEGMVVRLWESRVASASAVVARTAIDVEAAAWPALLVGKDVTGAQLPVVPSTDPAVVSVIDEHLDEVMRAATRVYTTEAFGTLPFGAEKASFTRFGKATTGGERVAVAPPPREGVFVALVIAYATSQRAGSPLGKRVVLYRRPGAAVDERRLSLASSTVEYTDVRRAREAETQGSDIFGEPFDLTRPSMPASEAAEDVADYLEPDGALPERVLREAAARGVFTHLGLVVHPDRLQPIPLPDDLRFVTKGDGRSPILPHLYALELTRGAYGHAKASELTVAQSKTDVEIEVLGYEDIIESRDLNDFLRDALSVAAPGQDSDPPGFLERTLRGFGIAPR